MLRPRVTEKRANRDIKRILQRAKHGTRVAMSHAPNKFLQADSNEETRKRHIMHRLTTPQINRRALCLLLTFTMLSPTAPDIFARSINPTRTASVAATDDDDEKQLTPEEEAEARRVATLFAARLAETEDYAVIVREFYQPDFVEHLRAKDRDSFPLYIVTDQIITTATTDDLESYYVAQMNMMNLSWRIYELLEARTKRLAAAAKDDGETPASDVEVNEQEIFTPEIVAVFKNDPFWGKEFNSNENGNASSNYCGDDKIICTVPLLNSVSDMSKKVIPLLRDKYRTLRGEELIAAQTARAVIPDDAATLTTTPIQNPAEEPSAESETEPEFEIELRVSDHEDRGCPPRTRIVCVTSKKHSLHLDFAADANGKLQLLPVVLYFD